MPTILGCFTAARNCRSATAAAAADSSFTLRRPLQMTHRDSTVSQPRYIQPSPPNAIGPLISYLSWTTSPALSCGSKLYSFPQRGQNPLLRLTFASHWAQKRLRSGTSGCVITSVKGSWLGCGGRDTSPPPSAVRREVDA